MHMSSTKAAISFFFNVTVKKFGGPETFSVYTYNCWIDDGFGKRIHLWYTCLYTRNIAEDIALSAHMVRNIQYFGSMPYAPMCMYTHALSVSD